MCSCGLGIVVEFLGVAVQQIHREEGVYPKGFGISPRFIPRVIHTCLWGLNVVCG